MTVNELIAQLTALPAAARNSQVILQKDSEGNGYSPLSGIEAGCVYEADSTYSGTVYSDEDQIDGYGDGCPPCVVLFPVN